MKVDELLEMLEKNADDIKIIPWHDVPLNSSDDIFSFREHGVKIKDANLVISVKNAGDICLGYVDEVSFGTLTWKVVKYEKPFKISAFERRLKKFLAQRGERMLF